MRKAAEPHEVRRAGLLLLPRSLHHLARATGDAPIHADYELLTTTVRSWIICIQGPGRYIEVAANESVACPSMTEGQSSLSTLLLSNRMIVQSLQTGKSAISIAVKPARGMELSLSVSVYIRVDFLPPHRRYGSQGHIPACRLGSGSNFS